MAKTLKLPYLAPQTAEFTREEILKLDSAIRRRQKLGPNDPVSTLELLTQAELDERFKPGSENWEVNVLEWPIAHTSAKKKNEDKEFMFTRAELVAYLERLIEDEEEEGEE